MIRWRVRAIVWCLLSLFAIGSTAIGQVIPHAQDKPPGPPSTPEEALKKMTVPPGFKVELVASEPDIVNPVSMTFDERGRVWITESLEYPRASPGPGRDRVKVLEDTDGDGKMEKVTVFAEGLNIPSGIAVGYGGVWVANSPDILFLQDTDGDGKADKQEVVVTGFGRTDTHELPNSLTWGPDGWLYGLNGVFNFSHVFYAKENKNYKADHPGWKFTCAMFRIHPRTREFQIFCEGTSNPWGIAFDTEGSAFISACVIDHLWHLVETGYYHRQGGPYPPYTWKIESIVKHKHQKAAYCGLTFFDSDAYPEQYREKLYMGNIHGNCINSDKLQRDGSTYFATAEPDFLSANDAWFMPVAQKTGPDGCLYVLDWYDQYHCYQDARRDPDGIERAKGRLYRVRYKDSPRAPKFDLAKETDEQLIERLKSPNVYFRDIAQRLLSERDNIETVKQLVRLLQEKDTPRKTRFHALFALAGMTKDSSTFVAMMQDVDSGIRAFSVRAAAQRYGFILPPAVGRIMNPEEKLTSGTSVSPEEWLQAAIAVSKGRVLSQDRSYVDLPAGIKFAVWLTCLEQNESDKLIPHVVWKNLQPYLEDDAESFVSVLEQLGKIKSPAVQRIIPRVCDRLLGRQKFDADVISQLFVLVRDAAPETARECLALLASRIQSGELKGHQLSELRSAFREPLRPALAESTTHPLGREATLLATSWNDPQAVASARQLFESANLETEVRLRALSALVAAGDGQVLEAAQRLLQAENPSGKAGDFAGQILIALGRVDNPRIAEIVLTAYAKLQPDVQPKAIELLTQRTVWSKRLLTAIGKKEIPAEALNVNQVRKLLATKDAELIKLVTAQWGTVREGRNPQRESIIVQMRTLLRSTPGDAHRGQEVYKKLCGQCHKIYGEGQEVGPDITLNGRSSFDQLLSNVFDPSLVIGAGYQARTVVTTQGRVLTGLVAEDNDQRIVLKVQGGKQEIIPRNEIEETKLSELSLMPEDLEKQLKPQEIADLFAFITLDKPPTDPTAKQLPGVRDEATKKK